MLTKFQWLFGRRFREEEDDGGSPGPSPAQVNDRGNRARVDRLARIANVADGNRASELDDVDGDRTTGRFAGGEFDDSAEARERAAEREEAEAQAALEAQREAAEEEERENARRLQEEGRAEDEDEPGRVAADETEEGDERVINGVKHYAVAINGQVRWLTLKQLREDRAKAGDVDKALQDAQAALQSAAAASLRPNPDEEEPELDEQDLRNVFTAAVMGDEEAIAKLVPLIARKNPGVSRDAVSQEVSRRLATQREVERSEAEQRQILEHPVLGGVFKQRLAALSQEKPTTRIYDAYQQVGQSMRKDFAAMLPKEGNADRSRPNPPADKATRKRSYVGPPSAASRQPVAQDPDREVPVGETIDQIARSRGQSRAIRSSRR